MTGEPDAGVAHGLKRLAEACGGSLRRGGGVIQFMRQTRGQLTERHQLIALRLHLGGLADAVGHNGHQTLTELGNSLQHFMKEAPVQQRNTGGKHGLGGAAEMRQPRVRQQTGNLAGIPSEDERVRATSPLYANLSLKDHDEMVQMFTLSRHDLSRLEAPFLELFRQPGEMFLGQVREDLDLAQIVDQTSARIACKFFRHVTPH